MQFKAQLIGNETDIVNVFNDYVCDVLNQRLVWLSDPIYTDQLGDLGEVKYDPGVEVLLAAKGAPKLDVSQLEKMPRLKLVLYAGDVSFWMTSELQQSGVEVIGGSEANAMAMAEFVLAQVILGLKSYRLMKDCYREEGRRAAELIRKKVPGNFETTIGLVNYNAVARHLRAILSPFEHKILLRDECINASEAEAEGVELSSLEGIFKNSEAVCIQTASVKAPIIRGIHLGSMKPNAVLVMTTDMDCVHEGEFEKVLQSRRDITAVFDIQNVDSMRRSNPLFALPNVQITPCLSQLVGRESARIGRHLLERFEDWAQKAV